MFAQMPQPLGYAETLLGQYDRLVGLVTATNCWAASSAPPPN